MSMTRRDYIAVAAVINDNSLKAYAATEPTFQAGIDAAREYIAEALALQFRRDNASFDRQRFLTACGVSE